MWRLSPPSSLNSDPAFPVLSPTIGKFLTTKDFRKVDLSSTLFQRLFLAKSHSALSSLSPPWRLDLCLHFSVREINFPAAQTSLSRRSRRRSPSSLDPKRKEAEIDTRASRFEKLRRSNLKVGGFQDASSLPHQKMIRTRSA